MFCTPACCHVLSQTNAYIFCVAIFDKFTQYLVSVLIELKNESKKVNQIQMYLIHNMRGHNKCHFMVLFYDRFAEKPESW